MVTLEGEEGEPAVLCDDFHLKKSIARQTAIDSH